MGAGRRRPRPRRLLLHAAACFVVPFAVVAVVGHTAGSRGASTLAAVGAGPVTPSLAPRQQPFQPSTGSPAPGTATPVSADLTPDAVAPTGTFAGVSCTGPGSCTVVGAYDDAHGVGTTLAAARHGATWSVEPTPAPPGATYSYLASVSCQPPVHQPPGHQPAQACMAVGGASDRSGTSSALAESWDGSAWTITPTPAAANAADSYLAGVGCASASSCVAVGTYTTAAGASMPLVERWDGRSWSFDPSPSPAGARATFLNAVSCAPAAPGDPSSCVAVGDSSTALGVTSSLAERSDGGAWQIEPTPAAGGATTVLDGVSCPSAAECTAVGSAYSRSGDQLALIERSEGSRWVAQPDPGPPGATSSVLGAVACSSATACQAVGYADAAGGVQVTLAEAWDGSAWSVRPTSAPSPSSSELAGVACTSAAACTAVGYGYAAAGSARTLAEGWDGTRWSLQATPDLPGATTSQLSATSCPSPRSCMAVGYDVAAGGDDQPLAEAWDGATWRLLPTPTPPSRIGVVAAQQSCGASGSCTALSSVSCRGPDACTAVGYQTGVTGVERTLAEAWDGATWTIQPAPALAAATSSALYGVSCAPGGTACVAVGNQIVPGRGQTPLIERWDGTTWRVQVTPDPHGAASSSLVGVSCPSPASCTAVGSAVGQSGEEAPLAEQWDGTSWTLAAVATPARASGSQLDALSCPQPARCTAVGDQVGPGGREVPLAEVDVAGQWAVVPIPDPPGADGTQLSGAVCTPSSACTALYSVSCAAVASCTAVGVYYDRAGTGRSLAEVWDGRTWRVVTSPDAAGASFTGLYGVACPAAGRCRAVGADIDRSNTIVTLAWTGAS